MRWPDNGVTHFQQPDGVDDNGSRSRLEVSVNLPGMLKRCLKQRDRHDLQTSAHLSCTIGKGPFLMRMQRLVKRLLAHTRGHRASSLLQQLFSMHEQGLLVHA